MIETNVNERAWNSHLGCATNGPQLAKSDYAAREDRIYDLGFGEIHAPLPVGHYQEPPITPFRVGDCLAINGVRLTITEHGWGNIERTRVDGKTPFRYYGCRYVLSDGTDKTWDELVYLFRQGQLVDLRDESTKQSA